MARPEYLYSAEHEWLRREGDEAVVGITEYAANRLGEVTYVELPEEGRQVRKGEAVASVESVKAVSDVFAPASGAILAVNNRLEEEPGLINESPYEDGWICRIALKDEGELAGLMDAKAYQEYVEAIEE